jgi:hypothetical protein
MRFSYIALSDKIFYYASTLVNNKRISNKNYLRTKNKMVNRDLLKEAIADAKAVKETAIVNAKAALEEAFTPLFERKVSCKVS